MNWQPPPPPPRPGAPGGPQPGGPGQPRQMPPGGGQPQPQGQPGGQPQQPPGGAPPQVAQAEDWSNLNYYQLLQVNREAHPTIIRYAYRFLAAMYHPDNSESGDADKFRTITEAFRTLSDEGKRAAYDLSLPPEGAGGGGGAPGAAPSSGPKVHSGIGKGLPKIPKTGVSWNEIELRLAILQILLEARKQKPKSGGANPKIIMDVLGTDDMAGVEFAIWYLREKGFIEMGERLFMISADGVDYIVDQLSKTQILDGVSETEKKVTSVKKINPTGANLPAKPGPNM